MRRLLALTLLAAAAVAPAASAAPRDDAMLKLVQCIKDYNQVPEPGYGGWLIQPEETIACGFAP